MSPEQDDFLDEDEHEEYAPRSIFAAGWFRAVLVLTVLAIVVVVSLPYLLNWFEPSPSTLPRTATRSSPEATRAGEPPSTLIPAAPAPSTTAPARPEATAPVTSSAPSAPAAPAPEKMSPAPAAPPASAQAQSAPSVPAKPLLQPPASKSTEASRRTAAVAPKAEPVRPASSGAFYVQVGLFKEPRNAQALAKALSAEGFPVETTRVTRGGAPTAAGAQRHELFITGSSAEAVNAALKGRGVAQSVQGGVSVRPAYDLKQATSLSKELSAEGLKVVIRRAGRSAGDAFVMVRVGGFPDRAKAVAAREELQGKGHAGFITQGAAK